MTSSHETIRPLARVPWWKRGWARALQALLLLVGLTAAVRQFEDWRGARALRWEKSAMLSRGEPLELSAVRLPPVPAEANFMESAVMQEVLSGIPVDESSRWAKATNLDANLINERLESKGLKTEWFRAPNPENIEQWRDGFEQADMLAFPAKTNNPADDIYQAWLPDSAEFFQDLYDAAAQRPHSRLDFTDAELIFGDGSLFREKSRKLSRLTQSLILRARLALMSSRPEEAIHCVRVILRLGEVWHAAPGYLSFLHYSSIIKPVTELVYEAARTRAFTPAQWQEVTTELETIGIHTSYLMAFRGESIALNARIQHMVDNRQKAISEILESMRASDRFTALLNGSTPLDEGMVQWRDRLVQLGMTLIPSGWFLQNNATILRWRESYLLIHTRGHSLPHLAAHLPAFERMCSAQHKTGRYHPERFLALQAAPLEWHIAHTAFSMHIQLQLARTAAATEMFYLETGRYPDTLAALVPHHLAAIPIDLDGQPLRYRLSEKTQRPVMHSVGKDLIDNRGTVHPRDISRQLSRYPTHTDGYDCVWSYDPPPEKERPRNRSGF